MLLPFVWCLLVPCFSDFVKDVAVDLERFFDSHAATAPLSWVVADVSLVAPPKAEKKVLALRRPQRFVGVESAEEE